MMPAMCRPKRFPDGFCRRAKLGEPGLLVFQLDPAEHTGDLYTDKKASAKPFLHDVLEKVLACLLALMKRPVYTFRS